MKGKIRIKIPWFVEAEFEIDNSKNTKKIAWELYCELSTRAGVVDFNEHEDLIIYCLDSWYDFFQLTRQNIKRLEIPKKKKIEKREKKGKTIKEYYLSEIILKLLNNELRPFLRKWHGAFRHYWEFDSKKEEYPIQRQKDFTNYNEIIKDLYEMQNKLKETSKGLYEIAVS